MKTCAGCDFVRVVKTFEECRKNTKKLTRKEIKDATMCVHPDSPYYGEYRKYKADICCCYHNYFEFCQDDPVNGDEPSRIKQLELVNKYRSEKLKLSPIEDRMLAPYF